MSGVIRTEYRGSTAVLVLDRPQVHNAFDAALVTELTQALESVERDERVRAVVLTGEGRTFSAGADLNWMRGMASASEQENLQDSLRLAKLMRTLNFLPKPTIARVNGSAYGGGVGLVACCDIAIAIRDAKFSLSEVRLGLVPAVISPYVVASIGPAHARHLFLTAEVFDGGEAERIGLVHRCVAADMFDEAVERQLHWLSKGGPVAQREAKALALRMAGMTPEDAERRDAANAAVIARLRAAPEGQEGLTAFLAKRPAHWLES